MKYILTSWTTYIFFWLQQKNITPKRGYFLPLDCTGSNSHDKPTVAKPENEQRKLYHSIFVFLFLIQVNPAVADLNDVPGMTPPQAAAASALQNIFTTLGKIEGSLTPLQEAIFNEARELVHTANEQQGEEPITFSLHIDEEDLRDALQWNANEEINNSGTVASKTIKNQQSNLISRIAALRGGATGFSVAGFQISPKKSLAYSEKSILNGSQRGGSAGSDSGLIRNWGGFINTSYGFGEKSPTPFEDAFEFSSGAITFGLDFRWSNDFILGAAIGYSILDSDFDSDLSTVNGKVDSHGYSLSSFLMHQYRDFYFDGLLSFGFSNYDMVRKIQYASNNPLLGQTNETALSDTDSTQRAAGFTAGYETNRGALSFSPYLKANYLDITIHGFKEGNANAFNLEVSQQDINSLTSVLGTRFSYAISTQQGVFIPQIQADWHHEFNNDQRQIRSQYIGVSGSGLGFFSVPTEKPDRDFAVVGVGLSGVFANGSQLFIQYESLLNYQNLNNHLLTLGWRSEF